MNATFMLVLSLFTANLPETSEASYRFDFRDEFPASVRVEASLPYSKILKVSTYGAWSQPNGWGTFVRDLRVFDENGEPLAVKELEKCQWRIAPSESSRITVSYRVDLSHAQSDDWSDGPKTTGAYWDGLALFTVTAPLILFTESTASFQFEFNVPKACQVLTAWDVDEGSNSFKCSSREDAIENTIVLGKPDVLQARTSCFNATVAMLGEFRGRSHLIAPVVQRYLDYYEDFYQEASKQNYLVVMFPEQLETGEAYSGSYVHVSPQTPSSENRLIWSGIIAHELGHFWLGKKTSAKNWAECNWFSEGATEYLATRAMLRCGEINVERFLDIVQRNVEFYILFKKGRPFEAVSLVEAGSNKSSNNVAIYNGGWVACFCLDVIIREQTNNQKCFDDFVRLLVKRYGQAGKKYDIQDLIQISNQTADSSIRDFFDRYVLGKETIPLENFLKRAGFTASIGAASAYVGLDQKASGIANRIGASMMERQSSEIEESLDKIFDKWNLPDSPGAMVTITRNGQVIRKSYGSANLEFGVPIDSETIFHCASVAKQFTAYLVMLLDDRGKLSLDDPVSKFLPNMNEAVGRVTLGQLMDHTSGIRDQWQLLALSGVQPEDVVTQDQVLRLIERQSDLQFEPGTRQAYCNSGYTMLASIVEQVSGLSFSEFAQREIFGPLKMEKTFFRDSVRKIIPNRADSYRVDSAGQFERRPLNYATYGATSFHTCGSDVALWMSHLQQLHSSESPILKTMLERKTLGNGDQINFTNGLFVARHHESLMIGHPGADAGFRSSVFVFPEENLGVAVLANTNNIDHWQIPKTIANLFLPIPKHPNSESKFEASKVENEALLGSYTSANGEVIVIDKRFGKLCYSIAPDYEILELIYVSPTTYRIKEQQRDVKFELKKNGGIARTCEISSSGVHPIRAHRRQKMSSEEMKSLIGDYYSVELDSHYSVFVRNGELCLKHLRNGMVTLREKYVDRFGTDSWYLPEVQFVRDQSKNVLAFEVRLHDERGIRFVRQTVK